MRRLLTLTICALAAAPAVAGRKKPGDVPPLDQVAGDLLGAALVSDEATDELAELCHTIGHRLTGSDELVRAVDWAAERMQADDLDVRKEPVPVRVWRRNAESLHLLAPVERELGMLGLGWSVGTPPGGVEGEVLVVGSWDELAAMEAEAHGKIVLFDVPFTTYGDTVQYRSAGASRAAAAGATAMLLSSVGSATLYTPHTGTLRYDEALPRIPAAAIPIEDARWIHALVDRGIPVRARLEMGAEDAGEAVSHNVVGEVRGREHADEVVVLGCHLDSWDVGQGAQDDGFGCTAVMEAVALVAALPHRPRRTLRAVLYTNEENGLAGARTYAAAHTSERHVAAIETDTGSGLPAGFRLDVRGADADARLARATAALRPVADLLGALDAGRLAPGGSGADVGPLVEAGAIGLGVDHDLTHYFDVHHTWADTFDKIDPDSHKRTVAALAVMGYALAELPELP